MKNIKYLVALLFLITACKHDSLIEIPASKIDCNNGEIDFVNQVLPILQTSCAVSGCHNAGSKKDGVILDTYKNIMETGGINAGDANSSKLYEVLVETGNDIMPPTSSGMSLSASQKNIIKDWINQGAKNVECNQSTTSCDSVNVSFANTLQPMLDLNCVSCHTTGNTNGVFLNNYANVLISVNNGSLFGSINHESGFDAMPKDLPKLGVCELTIVKNWIAEGALNN